MPKSPTAVKIYEQQNAIEKNWHLERYFVTKEYAQKLRSFFVGPGDIIVSCAGTIGELYVLPPDAQEGLINQALMRIRVKSSLDKNWFIYAFMRMIDKFSAKFSNGSAIKNIPPFADLKNYELFLPNILEQQRIARMLLAIDHRISVQNKIIEAYESLINPLFNVLNACEKRKISLGELGVYRSADNLSWDEISGKGDPTIIYGELFTTYQLIARDIKSLSDVQIASTSSGRDILFPASTTVDSLSLISPVALYEEGVKLGGDMFFISLKEEYDPLYISLLLNLHCKRALSKYAQGSTIIHLHFEDIENFTIFVPDAKKQREISSRILHILDLIDCERKKLKLLLKQKQFFLNELFI